MHCFYHQDKEAIGVCKSCGKGVCTECAVDLSKGLACRNRCEDNVRTIIQFMDRAMAPTKAQVVIAPVKAQAQVMSPTQRKFQSTDHIATLVTSHIEQTRRFGWLFGAFCLIVGSLLIFAGTSQQVTLLEIIIGAFFIVCGVVSFSQSLRSAKQPKPETQTR